MSWEVTEPLLDQLAAIIGIFMFLVAAYVFIKLLTQPRSPKEDHRDSEALAPKAQEISSPSIPKAKAEPVMAHSFSFPISGAETPVSGSQAAPRPQPSTPRQIPSIGEPPKLAFGKITRSGNNLIRLTLTNIGSDMKFERVCPDKFNEIDVSYQSRARLGTSYGSQASMNFLLKGSDLDYHTYHFKVFYKDKSGKRYVQEIAGLGDEVPIVEAPMKA